MSQINAYQFYTPNLVDAKVESKMKICSKFVTIDFQEGISDLSHLDNSINLPKRDHGVLGCQLTSFFITGCFN